MNENYNIRFCKNCGTERNNQEAICINCGFNFENTNQQIINPPQPEQKYCPKCGMEVIPEDKYCIECGYEKKYIYKPIDNTNNDIEFTEEKEPSILWIVLLVLAIINMIFFGLIAGLLMIVSFFVTLGDFTDGIGLFLVSGGYFAASVYAIKFCSKRTTKNKR